MSRTIRFVVLLLAISVSNEANAGRRGQSGEIVAVIPDGPEGIGCYWDRERIHCARYCYIEVDGHRFCRERPRDAHSQAPPQDLAPMILTPMK